MTVVTVKVTKHKTLLKRSTQYRWTAYAANGRKVATSGESYNNRSDLLAALTLLGLAEGEN